MFIVHAVRAAEGLAFESVRRAFSYSKNIAPFLYRVLPSFISSRIMGGKADASGCECILPQGLSPIATVEKLSRRVRLWVAWVEGGRFARQWKRRWEREWGASDNGRYHK
mmetsp:Transcript_26733/g.71780  ORF Transcript_26733/g.71780 Transcript_26733/m.71780 type:complete len:110 (+) Transcript_26733:98-427(+)